MSDSAFGPDGNIYVADYLGGILRYSGTTGAAMGTFVPVGSGGLSYPNRLALVPSASGGLSTPRGLLFAADGSLLVASWNSNSVLRYDGLKGDFLDALVAPGAGGLDWPTDLLIGPEDTLLVISTGTTRATKRYNLTTGAYIADLIAGSTNGPGVNRPSCISPAARIGRGPTVNLRRLTLRDGNTTVGDGGAALSVEPGASVAVRSSVVQDNRASWFGGGIQNRGTLTLDRTEVLGNQLPPGGGGVTSTIVSGGMNLIGAVTSNCIFTPASI